MTKLSPAIQSTGAGPAGPALVRGVMFDVGRLIERPAFYYDLIPHLARWGYNTIFWHFTDNHHCAYRFHSVPGIAHKHAFTRQQMEKLIRHGRKHGLEIVPEIESLGHAKYLTDIPQYRHLLEAQGAHIHTTICPSHPDTWDLMRRMFTEAAAVFPSEYMHAGLDEAEFGHACQACWLRVHEQGKAAVFAEYVRRLHGLITGLDKTMLMWADMLLRDRSIADLIPKDIVVCHWRYRGEISAEPVRFLTRKGFRVICCPSILSGGSLVWPGAERLNNVKAHTALSRRFARKGVVGLMNTLWVPYQHLQGAVVHGIALTGHIFRDGKEPGSFDADFVRRYFGLEGRNARIGAALRGLYKQTIPFIPLIKLTPCNYGEMCLSWGDGPVSYVTIRRRAQRVLAALRKGRSAVTRNRIHYQDLLVSVEILAGLVGNAGRMRRLTRCLPRHGSPVLEEIVWPAGARPILRRLSMDYASLHKKAVACWNRTRFADDPLRDGLLHHHRAIENLTFRLRASARFLAACGRAKRPSGGQGK